MGKRETGAQRWARWFGDVACWLVVGTRPVIAILAAIPIVWTLRQWLFPLAWFDATEPRLRWVGMLFQLGGFITTVAGFVGLGKLFNSKSLRKRIGRWRKAFPQPPRRPQTIHAQGNAHLGDDTLSATAQVRPSANRPIEERVAWLIGEVDKLQSATRWLSGELQEHRKAFAGALSEVEAEQATANEKAGETMAEAVAGGLPWQWVGIFYFVVGVILASASVELARWPFFTWAVGGS